MRRRRLECRGVVLKKLVNLRMTLHQSKRKVWKEVTNIGYFNEGCCSEAEMTWSSEERCCLVSGESSRNEFKK